MNKTMALENVKQLAVALAILENKKAGDIELSMDEKIQIKVAMKLALRAIERELLETV